MNRIRSGSTARAFGLRLALCGMLLLFASPVPAVEVGDEAPGFRLKSTTGEIVSLSDYRGKKNVVVQFYVLDFTPG